MNIQQILEYYDILEDGSIYSKRNSRFLKLNLKKNGYVYVQLNINGESKWFRVHRLIAEVYVPNPLNKPYVNHKDGNKSRNFIDNLEWVTGSENNIHAIENKLFIPRKMHYAIYQYGDFICNVCGIKEACVFINKSSTTVITSKNKPTKDGYSVIPLNV